ncbi:FAD-dependent oxidoreductase [candidate division KSB1 bacterium]|nr:FAD-dependent oxidoreductase [candidate division KSB1 bacterium]
MQDKDFIFQPVTIQNVHFRNPFYVASGPTTRNLKQLLKAEECGWGGASIKLTIGPEPYINREPRYGWFKDQGVLAFTTEKRLKPDEGLSLVEKARKHTSDLVIMANITYAGDEDVKEGWGGLAKQFESAGAHIIELNMCCPNMSYNLEISNKGDSGTPKTGASLGQDAEAVSHITRIVKESVNIPVFVKLTPEGGRIAQVANACFEAGATAVGGTANRLAIPPFDIYNPGKSPFYLQDELSLSCFASEFIKPLALRDVFEIRKLVGDGPIITATGGIRNFQDVVQMTFMGANFYGICAETILSGFGFLKDVIRDLRSYFDDMNYSSFDDFRGSIVNELRSAQTVTLSKGYARVKDRSLSAPCVVACPNYVPAQGYVMAVAKKDFKKAYNLITASGPFQSVCAYVCTHPCESVCVRGNIDEAIKIKEIKRFVLEYAGEKNWQPELNPAPGKPEKVAVIGAGPAGLSAAFYLKLAGYEVVVFEKQSKAGGLLRSGIPRYRLPLKVVDEEIKVIENLGVKIKTNKELFKDFTIADLKSDGFGTVILAIGAHKGIPLQVSGELSQGNFTALNFLDRVSRGEKPDIGNKVVVVGGGFSAIDAARTCKRMGAEEVYIAYRRTRDEMPASPEDVMEAEEEGVKIMYLVSPEEIIVRDNKVAAIRLVNYVLGEMDDSDRRKPVEVAGTEFILQADTVISALGQKIDIQNGELTEIMSNGAIRCDVDTGKTGLDYLFVAGDAASEPEDIISAIASGKKVAFSVDKYLSAENAVLIGTPQLSSIEKTWVLESKGNTERKSAVKNYVRSAGSRVKDFQEYTRTFTEEEAVAEAGRCLNCGCGDGCMQCMELCNSFAISNVDGKPFINKEECAGCGICVWRCPNHNIEMIRD